MKLLNFKKTYLFIVVLLVGFTFSSCSDDDGHRGRWIPGAIDFAVEPVTWNNGYFEQSVLVDNSFIQDLNGRWINPNIIDNWTLSKHFEDTFIEVSNMRIYGNGVITWFEIIVEGRVVYIYNGRPIKLLGEDVWVKIDDNASRNAMADAVSQLMRYGDVEITVRGQTNLRDIAEPIYFDFYNGMDFYILD